MYEITLRNQVIAEYKDGKSITSISQSFGISKSCIYKWISLYLPHQSKFDEIVSAVKEYVEFYNEYRPHKSLSYKTPNQVEEEFFKNTIFERI